MSELKPCPFCGSENVEAYVIGYMECNDCGACGPDADQERRGITWNTRAQPAPAKWSCEWVWKGNGWVASCEPYVLQTHQTKFCSSCGKRVIAALQGGK